MHILVISDAFPPDPWGDAARLWAHSDVWAQAGEKVTILVTRDPAPGLCRSPSDARQSTSCTLPSGIRVIRRCASPRAAGRRWSRPGADLLALARLMVDAWRAGPIDVIVCGSCARRPRLLAFALSRLRRRPLVLEILGGWQSADRGGTSRFAADASSRRRLRFLKSADAVIAASRSLRDGLVGLGVAPTRLEIVADGLDWNGGRSMRREEALSQGLGPERRFVVGWAGTGAGMPASGLFSRVVQGLAAAGAADRFRMVPMSIGPRDGWGGATGTGLEREPCACCSGERASPGAKEPRSSPQPSATLDICVLAGDEDNASTLQRAPPLIYDCIRSGVPVLVGVPGEAADLVQREGVGLVFPNGDGDALTDLLLRIQRDDLLRARLIACCRDAAPQLDRASRALHMLEVLRGVSARHKMFRQWRVNRRLSR